MRNTAVNKTPESAQQENDLNQSNSLTDLAARIRKYHEETAGALRRSIEHGIAAGELLIEAKAQLKHGQWLPWLKDNCAMSDRTAQLYMKLAKNRETIEAKSANFADLNLNEVAAMLTLSVGVEKLMDFAKRAALCESSEALIDLCIERGFTVIKDEDYDPFYGRSEIEVRDWLLFAVFIGDFTMTHTEWLLQGGNHPAFWTIDGWLRADGDAWRRSRMLPGYTPTPEFKVSWEKFRAARAHLTRAEAEQELRRMQADADANPQHVIRPAHGKSRRAARR